MLQFWHRQINVVITGRVHGVFFRKSTCDWAREHGVVGWVRNDQNGSVRIVAKGSQEQLRALLNWIHTQAPGHVDRATSTWQDGSEHFSQFEIR